MFPLRDDIPSSRYPLVNNGLILLNVVIFLLELTQGANLEQVFKGYGFTPARFSAQLASGSVALGLLPLFTSMFLHGGVLHILANMWTLWIFGDNVEDSMGHLRYLFFYLLCGVLSSLSQFGLAPHSALPLVGASGAIAGVLGGYVVLYPQARILTLVPIFIIFYLVNLPAYVFVGFWFLVQLLMGSATALSGATAHNGGIAWWVHVGGFCAGVVLIRLFAEKGSGRPH